MTDRRVTDLSYGHLGEASYDTEVNRWEFSNTKDQDQRIQQLLPLKERLPPSIQNAPKKDGRPSQIAKTQLKWLLKTQPETFPANTITSTLAKAHDGHQTELSSRSGSRLTAGRAVDVDRVSGSRNPRILCLPCGGAGHILQLIRPRTERRGWGKQSAARLSLMDLEFHERGYWVGIGGAIQQIESADDENESGTWLAVRQDTLITIFRPLYGKLHRATGSSTGYEQLSFTSRLNPNPVAALTTERAKSENYMDVSFNPWYARQFAIVDARGQWSIWDLERLHGKGSPEELLSGKSGHFYEDYNSNPTSKVPQNDHADGWYRIMWACNINTMVICNRRNIAVFDIKSVPTRLRSLEIFTKNSTEWILDMKRSPEHLNHLFILTSSRIFWIEVVPTTKDREDQSTFTGLKVILSYQHFRDSNDKTLRLTVVQNDPVTAFISSAKMLLVNFYCFWLSTDASGSGTSFNGSLTLISDSGQLESEIKSSQTFCVLPTPLTSISSPSTMRPELQYVKQDVRFFQLWILTSDLGLNSTLLSVIGSSPEQMTRSRLLITAPNTKISQPSRPQGPRVVKDSFIVSDGMGDERFWRNSPGNPFQYHMISSVNDQERDDLRFRLNWVTIFQHVFGLKNRQNENFDEPVESPEEVLRIDELLGRVLSLLQEERGEGVLRSRTLHEISAISGLAGDLEQASSSFRNFLESLQLIQNLEENSTLVLSDLTACPAIQFPLHQESNYPDLLRTYNQLAENWMTSLPPKVSAQARLSKFRTTRQIAVELCLSSLAVSLRSKATDVTIAPTQDDYSGAPLPELDKEEGTTRESSPANYSPQIAPFLQRERDFNLPIPAQTPSLYSHATSTSELREDPALSRLRQYAVSINSKPDFGKPPILSHWPSTPGSDPAQYSWDATQKAAGENGGVDESDKRNRKEEARRRRRTENFLKQERARAAEAVSQPMVVIPSGSQPLVTHNGFSSQTVDDVPMTQPDRGAFGSRSAQKGKKKPKKHRTAGF